MPEQSHVLIVDDNKDFLEIVSVYLGAKGFLTSVLHTEDGEGVLEIECWIENQRGENTTPGRAVAAVPRRTP